VNPVMKIEILVSSGCGHGAKTQEAVADVVREVAPGTAVETVLVGAPEDAARLGFLGSPSVRVNGRDIEA